jgi:bacterioferritin (cytochrome b1)
MDAMRKRELVSALKEALRAELKAVKMYDVHATVIADPEIAQGLRTVLEVEKGHAQALVDRIEALGAQPVGVESSEAAPGIASTRDPVAITDMLISDLSKEQWAIKHYAATIADFLPDADGETLTVLEENLVDELRHAHWLRDRLLVLAKSG